MLGACAWAPIVVFGLISVQLGWWFFPNSVLLKGNTPNSLQTWLQFYFAMFEPETSFLALYLLSLMVLSLLVGIWAVIQRRTWWSEAVVWQIVFIGTTLLHLQFAKLHWFFRYEAWLVVLGLLALVRGIVSLRSGLGFNVGTKNPAVRMAWLSMLSMVGIPALFWAGVSGGARGWLSVALIPRASNNIYDQQYQMGSFLREYYEGEGVGANDIGAVSFFGDVRTVDLYGLANMEVARARRAGRYDSREIDRIARREGVKVAVVHDRWFNDHCGGVSKSWVPCGRWTIPNNYLCADKTVTFYAVDPSESQLLRNHLRDFELKLPRTIQSSIDPVN